tara:strand:- start:1399 stop:1752 length:354 start_codon:yes stop_codon:yes gene_type:complete
MEEQVTKLLGKYGWMFLAGASIFLFKSTIESAVEGLKVFLGGDLNTDDVVILDRRPARVIRVGLWKTTFFIYTIKRNGKLHIDSGNKMSIQNDQLKMRDIEKPLKKLDLSQWEDDDK